MTKLAKELHARERLRPLANAGSARSASAASPARGPSELQGSASMEEPPPRQASVTTEAEAHSPPTPCSSQPWLRRVGRRRCLRRAARLEAPLRLELRRPRRRVATADS